jgi:hypothetical protein
MTFHLMQVGTVGINNVTGHGVCNTMPSFYQRRPELSNEMAPVKSAAVI